MDSWLDDRLDRALCAMVAERNRILRELLKKVPALGSEAGGAGLEYQLVRGITPEQFTIVTILDRLGHPVPVTEIAEQIDTPHSNVSRTLDRLEKKGLILRLRSKTDRRQVDVRLTLQGKRLNGLLNEIKERFYRMMWDKFPDDEKVRLLDLLTR